MADQQIDIGLDLNIAEFAAKMSKVQSMMQKFQQSASMAGQKIGGMDGAMFGDIGNLEKQSGIINRLKRQAQELSGLAQPISESLGAGESFESQKQFQGMSEVLQTQAEQVQGTTKDWDNYFNSLEARGRRGGPLSGRLATTGELLGEMGDKAKKTGSDMSKAFDEAALGVMFFGMQIQRIFGGIIRSGISTFNKVHSQLESTTTATDRLSGAWKFLKFNIGEAMQPLMAFLFPIVEGIARWVEEHQKLTRWILLSGAAVGALLMAYGSLKLGIGAVFDMFSKLSGFLGGFSTLISPIAIAIAAVVAGLAGIAAMMSQSDFFSKEFKKNVLDPLGGAFSDLGINWGLLVDIGDVLLGVLTVLAQFLTSALSAAINLIVDGIGAMVDSFESLVHIVKAAKAAYGAFLASKLGMDAKAARAQAEAQYQVTQSLNDRADAIKNVKEANKAMDKAGRQMNLAFQSVRQGGFKFSEQMKFYKQLEKTAKATKGAKMSVAPNMSKVPRMSKVPSGGPGGMSKLPEKSMKDTAKETKKSNSFLSSIDQTLKQLNNDNISAETARSTVEDITSAANRQR